MIGIIEWRKFQRRISRSSLGLLGFSAAAARHRAFHRVDKSAPNSGHHRVSVERLPMTRLRAVRNLLQMVRD
jgi:hypothetical protein